MSRAAAHCLRAVGCGIVGAKLVARQSAVREAWPDLRFGQVTMSPEGGMYFCEVEVHLGLLRSDDVSVQMYADPLFQEPPFCKPMTLVYCPLDSHGFYRYTVRVPENRPAHYYTPRAVPSDTVGSIPLELPLITWQK
jgi:hypothetical protein